MSLIRKSVVALAVASALTMSPAPAQADEAISNVNVRSGPGTGFGIVDVLAAGEQADVSRRSGGWCHVIKAGPDGWVSCRYLTAGLDEPDDFADEDDIVLRPRPDRPAVSLRFSIPGFSFFVGDRDDFRIRPGRPGRAARVCFYEHVNYGGDRFCMLPGEVRASLGGWNDTISSIRVRGGAEAQVCEHNGFAGRCVVVDRNVADVGSAGNDIISSIRVR